MRRLVFLPALALVACTKPEPFSLQFAATDGAQRVDCETAIEGLGPEGADTVGLSDLRFYVSSLELVDADGEVVETSFDEDDFQYSSDAGWVALVDLTDNSTGSCASGAIAFSEGTARTHSAITGETLVGDVAGVRFDVGVPQAVMQEVIGTTTAEAAPSPLDEMYWSWATGYRHFVFNFTITEGEESGEGYVHVGSRNCAAEGELALESQDACEFVNTAAVAIDGFDLTADTVAVDLSAVLADVSFVTVLMDHETMEPIGEAVGVACHSSPMQTDCAPVFDSLGIDLASGASTASGNLAFGIE